MDRLRLAPMALGLGTFLVAALPARAASTPPTVPAGMVLIPEGPFWMGNVRGAANERPTHEVSLSSYAIDRTEVSVTEYAACVVAHRCPVPYSFARCNWGVKGRERHPMNCVDWEAARAYCAWIGGRLPTEAEWEKAARGTDGRDYPWGEWPPECGTATLAGCSPDGTTPVGSHPTGASPYGVLDMAGNVREWVADWYSDTTYRHMPLRNPKGPLHGKLRVQRGGSFADDCAWCLRSTARLGNDPKVVVDPFSGFRCVKEMGPPPAEPRRRAR